MENFVNPDVIQSRGRTAKDFEPLRSNQIYHSWECRLKAKSGTTVLIRVPADQAPYVKTLLAHRRSIAHCFSPAPGTLPRYFRQAALWLKNRMEQQQQVEELFE